MVPEPPGFIYRSNNLSKDEDSNVVSRCGFIEVNKIKSVEVLYSISKSTFQWALEILKKRPITSNLTHPTLTFFQKENV